jgi:hydroxymethylpyrimidine pyrophosphatase-like HAD family hydrolase
LKDKDVHDYVFGDDHGDIEMINNAYHGVLLSNSKLKDKCKIITKFDNNNDGVIKYMEEILKL